MKRELSSGRAKYSTSGTDPYHGPARKVTHERRPRNRRQHRYPNICRVFDGGFTDDGTPDFATEYVEGQPIHEDCDERRLTRQPDMARSPWAEDLRWATTGDLKRAEAASARVGETAVPPMVFPISGRA